MYSRQTSESNYKEREKLNVKVRKLYSEQDELMKKVGKDEGEAAINKLISAFQVLHDAGRMRLAFLELAKKTSNSKLSGWVDMMKTQSRGLTLLAPREASNFPTKFQEQMPIDFFNKLLDDRFAPFTPETYAVDKGKLLDLNSFVETVLCEDRAYNPPFLKRERVVLQKKMWSDYRRLKIMEAEAKGMERIFLQFKIRNKSTYEMEGLSDRDAWNEYKKTWALLMGFKPLANVWMFSRQAKIEDSVARHASSRMSEHEEEDESGEEGGGRGAPSNPNNIIATSPAWSAASLEEDHGGASWSVASPPDNVAASPAMSGGGNSDEDTAGLFN